MKPRTLPVGAVLVDSARLRRGSVAIADGRIADYVPSPSGDSTWFAIPGLRNAHTHLDLSSVGSVPRAERGFAAWVLDLLRGRGPFDTAKFDRAAALGAHWALASGTTAVADIDSSGSAAAAVAQSGLKGICFREILGSTPAQDVDHSLERWLADFGPQAASNGRLRMRPGISPHAPYSTPAALFELAARRSRDGIPFTTHIAETRAEAEYLRTLGGEFATLFATLRVSGPLTAHIESSPLRYLDACGGLAPGHLLAHANYPEPGDLDLLFDRGVIVAFCPRSHAFFGHSRHPVLEYLERGIPVALGTDSLASNGSLSMFDEMSFLAVSRPEIGARRIFEMATSVAAPLLDHGTGTLDVGRAADLVIVSARGGIPESVDDALEIVTRGDVRVIATLVDGEYAYRSPDVDGTTLA